MTSDKPLRVGIAGLGTVGSGLLALLNQHSDAIAEKGGRPISITGVCARSRGKPGAKLAKALWFDDPKVLAVSADIDVFVELMGGDKGPALESVKAALRAGKHVVTANKALLARHGAELAELAEKNGVTLSFEAAVAGGIPIVKTPEGKPARQFDLTRLRDFERHEQLHSDTHAAGGLAVRRCAG